MALRSSLPASEEIALGFDSLEKQGMIHLLKE